MRIAGDLPAEFPPGMFLYRSLHGNTNPSRRTYHRSKGSSPWEVSFPTVADKLDNFCATYPYLSSLT